MAERSSMANGDVRLSPPALWKLLKQTVLEWIHDKVPALGAALAFYTIFSIAPMIIVTVAVVGFIFGPDAAQGRIATELQGLVGAESARTIQSMIERAGNRQDGTIATIIGLGTILFGSTIVFAQLQDALNTVWGVKRRPSRGIWGIVLDRLLSFAMVLAIGFLLLVSLLVSAGITALGGYLGRILTVPEEGLQTLNFVLSFGIITVLFAMIYKVLPDVRIKWSDVWIGAMVTALLFTIGKFLIGLYLGRSSVSSAYGAAGSFIVVLLWVYYSSQILLFGAEFTQVYANMFGSHIHPVPGAIVEDKFKAARGDARADLDQQEPERAKSAGAA
jgi:membrane protein